MHFAQQEDNEIIELVLRQHWVTNIPWILLALILFLLPVIAIQFAPVALFALIPNIPYQIILFGLVLWYLLVFAYIFEKFLFWYFNIYIVTNLHLVDVNFRSLQQREVIEIKLQDIESSSSNISGIIRSLFNYGDVVIQTAADVQDITFDAVPYPDLVVDRIGDLKSTLPPGGNP